MAIEFGSDEAKEIVAKDREAEFLTWVRESSEYADELNELELCIEDDMGVMDDLEGTIASLEIELAETKKDLERREEMIEKQKRKRRELLAEARIDWGFERGLKSRVKVVATLEGLLL